jgi:hypothetical protein
MIIYGKTLKNRKIPLNVDKHTTINSLKYTIRSTENSRGCERIHLFFQGTRLKDEFMVGDYKIEQGDIIDVVFTIKW